MRFIPGPQHKGSDGRVRWALMSSFDIPCTDPMGETRLYLRRLRIIQTPWFGLYLHEMHSPDLDADVHDHPWPFYTFILKGGYIEEHQESFERSHLTRWIQRWPRFSGHRMTTTEAHRIVNLEETPTYTLVFAGKRSREWGFWKRDALSGKCVWIPWQEYNEERAV